jgi:hypothetical protein
MAIVPFSWKDCTVTFGQALTAWVESVSGLKLDAGMEDFKPMGSAWPAPFDSGQRVLGNITIVYIYDAAATTTPNACSAIGSSGTLTIVLGTNQSIAATAIVASVEVGLGPEGATKLTVEYAPSGTGIWDLLSAA